MSDLQNEMNSEAKSSEPTQLVNEIIELDDYEFEGDADDSLTINVVSPADAALLEEINSIPKKMAFKIGEVADIAGVKQYVLRYWETEFEALKPKKSRHNQRMYSRKDVETVLLIKKLLYVDRFSISGARAAMRKEKTEVKRNDQIQKSFERVGQVSEKIKQLKDRIIELREQL